MNKLTNIVQLTVKKIKSNIISLVLFLYSIIMKLVKLIQPLINKIKENAISLLSLLCAIIALYYSQKSIELSVMQFSKNSIASDSLFQVQLDNSKRLNDSLIREVSKIQEINSELHNINRLQLNSIERLNIATKKTLDNIIYSERPNISNNGSLKLSDINSDEKYIKLDIQNIGKRTAKSIAYRKYIISESGEIIYSDTQKNNPLNISLESNQEFVLGFKFKTNLKQKKLNDFYFCYELSYLDSNLSKKFYYTKFTKYRLNKALVDKPLFYACNTQETIKLLEIINTDLKNKKERIFSNRPE